jgi:hypothetical protein
MSLRRHIIIAFVVVTPIVIADIFCAIRLSKDSKEPLPPVKDYGNRSGIPGTV